MNLEDKFVLLIKNIVNKHLPDAEIFVFGSRAKNNNKKFSDIDIAVKSQKIDFFSLAKIKFDLEESDLPYKVDVVNYSDLNKEILHKSVKI